MDDHVLNKHIFWGRSFQQVDGHIKKSQICEFTGSHFWTILMLLNHFSTEKCVSLAVAPKILFHMISIGE